MAYANILVSEHFLMAKDDSVLPMIKTYALSLAAVIMSVPATRRG